MESPARERVPAIRRVMATVQYDGTDFSGFQRQKGRRTVQEALEDALGGLLGHRVTVRAAGRTDAGVHARGQVVSFSTPSTVPAGSIPRAVSGFLPADVLMESAEEAALEFDALRDATGKTYCYRVWRSSKPDILWSRYSYRYAGALDMGLIREETEALQGRHDYSSFMARGSPVKSAVREVREARWVRKDVEGLGDALWEFWISADGFLYRMVRLTVGTLLDVGRGHLPPGTIAAALLRPGSVRIGRCVPGKGLCLEEVAFS